MRGLHEFEIEGKKRGFLINFTAFGIWEEQMDVSLDELLAKMADKQSRKIRLILTLFHAGAISYCEHAGVPVDFKQSDVSNWITEIGFEQTGRLLKEAISTATPKNLSPLQ